MSAETKLYDSLPVAVISSDIDGRLIYANPAAVNLLGDKTDKTSAYWYGTWKMYDHTGQPLTADKTPMYKVDIEKKAQKEELIIEHPENEYRNVLVYSVPTFPGEKYRGATHTLVDITEQKSDESRRAMLAAIIESSDDAIISKSISGIITSWNSAAERMFGYTEAEAIGKSITMLIPNERLDEENQIINKVMKGETVNHFETIRLKKTGEPLPISITVSPIKNRLGIITGASKIARDITHQKEAEARLQGYIENLEVFNYVGKTLSEDLDVQGILQKVTDATTQISGAEFGAFFYNVLDEKGDSLMLYTLSGAPREAFAKFAAPRITALFKPTFSGEAIVRIGDIAKDPRYGKNSPLNGMPPGHLPVVSYLAVPVISKKGNVTGCLLFGHSQPDRFTEEHERLVAGIASQAAVALDNAKMYEEIQNLNLKKDEFIGMASHELKTPVTSISGYLQIIEKNPDKWEQNQLFIKKTRAQVDKLSGLISDLLDVTKIETGRLPLKFSTFDLVELLREVIELLANNNPSYEIETDFPLDSFPVFADRLRLEQVIVNLITNAIRYSPKSNRIIVTMQSEGKKVSVSVQDFGIGIQAEHLKRIFNRFYRVDDLASHMSGLGIGLFISKEIINRHKGRLDVVSQPGQGSTFTFEIPVKATTQTA